MHEKIFNYLKNSRGYLSGEDISRFLNVSRTGIWKYIQYFRDQGYEIVAVPHLGYRLLSSPDKLFPWEIKYQLKTQYIGQNIKYYEEIESTMDEAFRLAIEGAPDGTIICAEKQNQGRGRLGRNWISPKGKGIYVSIVLKPRMSAAEVSRLTLLSAVAICEALNHLSDVKVQIKWPNDLMVKHLKLAGILTEMKGELDRVKFVIIGFGINVNTSAKYLPETATSLKIEAQKHFSRVEILREILTSMEKWYQLYQKQGFAPILKKWKDFSLTLGQHVCIRDFNNEVLQGEAIDLAADGGLLIKKKSGQIIKKVSGDVEFFSNKVHQDG